MFAKAATAVQHHTTNRNLLDQTPPGMAKLVQENRQDQQKNKHQVKGQKLGIGDIDIDEDQQQKAGANTDRDRHWPTELKQRKIGRKHKAPIT